MSFKFAEVEAQYKKDRKLKKEDVDALMEWIEKQPHLPKINEIQAILFVHSCYFNNEAAKNTIDNFFTFKTLCPELFRNEDMDLLSKQMELFLLTVLPRKTPEGFAILFVNIIDSNIKNFNFPMCVKYFDMVAMLYLHQEGIDAGHVAILDLKGITFAHITKLGIFNIKKVLYYLQEALCVRLRAVHFINIGPIVDKLMTLIKPFVRNDMFQLIHLHKTVESLTKFIPFECLPQDYGGPIEPSSVLHENIKKKLDENKDFFEWEESLVVDESKRLEKRKLDDILGTDGTFKKLEID